MDAINVNGPRIIAPFCVCSLFKTFNLKILYFRVGVTDPDRNQVCQAVNDG